MKLSDKPTEYILLRAGTNSEWDNCNFAIVCITEEWKADKQKQLKGVAPFLKDYAFRGLHFADTAVDFFVADDEDNPNVEAWFADKPMVFVEMDKEELESLPVPESQLDCYRLVLYSDGTAIYKAYAYGKYTDEEFYTEVFPLKQIIEQL